MKTAFHSFRALNAFTLVELIGVLAIIAILSGVVAPNAIRSLDRAAVRAERETLRTLGDQVKLHLRDTGAPVASANWTSQLAAYSDLSPADIAVNRRNSARIFVLDPSANPAPRAMILSSMRGGLDLPPAAGLNKTARFQQVWDTPDGDVPPSSAWSGWNRWGGVDGSGEFLVIERINLLPIHRTDLRSLTITLNNRGTVPTAYAIVTVSGAAQSALTIPVGATVVLSNMRPGQRIDLFGPSGASSPNYSYVLSDSGKTFDFDGSQWLPR